MSGAPEPVAWARKALAGAREPEGLAKAVMRFHRRLDEVLDASFKGHGVEVACRRGCSSCCSLQVDILPAEAFALAAWLRRRFEPSRLQATLARLRDNAARTRAMGLEARKRSNMPCALLGGDGACTAYEARPSQCRQFHSTRLETCLASHANPADDAIEAPLDPAVAHNAAVIITAARHALREGAMDAEPADMNLALLEALENPKAWRRWRDGKKAFVQES